MILEQPSAGIPFRSVSPSRTSFSTNFIEFCKQTNFRKILLYANENIAVAGLKGMTCGLLSFKVHKVEGGWPNLYQILIPKAYKVDIF